MEPQSASHRDVNADEHSTFAGRHLSAAIFAGTYILLATLWILGSDWLLDRYAGQSELAALLGTLKGWLFVVVTGLIFYARLRKDQKQRDAGETSPAVATLRGAFDQVSIGPSALALVAVAAIAAAAIYYRYTDIERREAVRIEAIAESRAGEVAAWIKHRFTEGEFLRSSALIAELYLNWKDHGNLASRDLMMGRIAEYRKANEYYSAGVVDERGKFVFREHSRQLDTPPQVEAAALRALASGTTQRTDIYHAPADKLTARLDFIIPLVGRGGPARGAVVLRVDPHDHLFPLLKTWPHHLTSTQTTLIHRDGERVIIVSESGKSVDAPPPAVDRKNVVALGDTARSNPPSPPVVTTDYRGIAVLGVARKVAGTEWLVVSKIEKSAIVTATVREAVWIVLSGLIAMLVIGVIGALYRTQTALRISAFQRRQQAERLQALQLLDTLADSSSDCIFAKDRSGRYLLFNREACRVTGKLREQVIGNDDYAIFPPEQAQQLLHEHAQLIASGEPVTREETLNTVDGTRTFLATKGPLRDADGAVTGAFGIAHDITRRKQDEIALRESATLLRSVQDSITSQLAVLDSSGNIIAVNAAWQRFFVENSATPTAPAPRAGVGSNYLDDCQTATGEDSGFAQEAYDGIRSVLSLERAEFSLEYPCHIPGTMRWFVMKITPLGSASGGAVVVLTDITERKLAAQLQADQVRILEMITGGAPQEKTLEAIALCVESLTDDAICSFMLADAPGKHLLHATAPSLPADFARAINGIRIGPGIGSCGTAAFLQNECIVEDITSHPYWHDFAPLAAPYGLRACWSIPILDAKHGLLGTFAIYRRTAGAPSPWHRLLINIATYLAATCINDTRTHAELARSELQYRSMVNSLNEGIVMFDSEGKVAACNPAVERIFGVPAAKMLTEWRDPSLWPMAFYENGEPVRPEDRAVRRALVTGESQRDIVRGRMHADGSMRWNIANIEPVRERDNGPVSAVIASFTDITERQNAAQQLRKLSLAVDQSFSGIMITDDQARIEYVNDAFCRTSGYARTDIIGRNPRMFSSGRTPKAVFEELWRTLGSGQAWKGEFINRRKNGEICSEFVQISPIRGTTGQITHYLGIREDITERKRIGAELDKHRHRLEELVVERTHALEQVNVTLAEEVNQRARAETEAQHLNGVLQDQKQALERALKNLESFSYSVSHDLRAPLRAISGFAQLLAESKSGQFDPGSRQMLDRIHAGAKKMDRMILDILEYSRVDHTMRRDVTVNMNGIASALVQDLTPAYPHTTVTIADLPVIRADATMAQQILSNLIGNAFKFSAKRADAHIDIGSVEKNGVPEFFVRDNGAGFDQRYADKLFGLFQRLHSEREFSGTGVGLAVVKRLVELHGGRISAESVPGEHTTFRFTLAPDTGATSDA